MSKLITESCAVSHYVLMAVQEQTIEAVEDALSCLATVADELMTMHAELSA